MFWSSCLLGKGEHGEWDGGLVLPVPQDSHVLTRLFPELPFLPSVVVENIGVGVQQVEEGSVTSLDTKTSTTGTAVVVGVALVVQSRSLDPVPNTLSQHLTLS